MLVDVYKIFVEVSFFFYQWNVLLRYLKYGSQCYLYLYTYWYIFPLQQVWDSICSIQIWSDYILWNLYAYGYHGGWLIIVIIHFLTNTKPCNVCSIVNYTEVKSQIKEWFFTHFVFMNIGVHIYSTHSYLTPHRTIFAYVMTKH